MNIPDENENDDDVYFRLIITRPTNYLPYVPAKKAQEQWYQ
jgi:hypothetical protein